jgi:sugar/nucleoside kinase (ribokinase family)
MSLVVTGSIGIDTIHAPTGRAERVLGGSCSYFAAAASFFGPVRVVAAAGGDWPDEHRRVLHGFPNIALDGLEVRPRSKTFAWGGRYMDDMNERETLFTELGVLQEEGPPVPRKFRDSRFVFLANTHPAEQMRLLESFPQRRLAVADTMDLWINVAHPELVALLQRVDGIVLNDSEAELLTETRNAISAARRILEMGPSFVIVKKGEHGCVLVHRDGVAALPAYPAEAHRVVDPTGAGDSFAGGLMGRLAATSGSRATPGFPAIQAALAWGTVVASFAIEDFSLRRLATLTRPEIDERLAAYRAAVRVE